MIVCLILPVRFRYSYRRTDLEESYSPWLLDLSTRQDQLPHRGTLAAVFLDLPAVQQESVLYLRQEELPSRQRAARTSLASCCAFLMIILGSFMVMWSPSQASSAREMLSAQLLQEFSLLHQSVSNADNSEQLPKSLDEIRQLEQQQQLLDPVVLKLDQRYRSPQDLLSQISQKFYEGFIPFEKLIRNWEGIDVLLLEQYLPAMKELAQQSRSAWLELLELTQEQSFADISEETAGQVLRTTSLVADIRSVLKRVQDLSDLAFRMVSSDHPQRILVLIADGNLQRGSSGALSVGLELMINGQELEKMKPVILKELDQQLRVRLQAPQGLEDITDSWGIATANTSFDALDSAQQMHWFWQREARSTLDFIVVINSRSLSRILENMNKDENAGESSTDFARRWSELRAVSVYEEMTNIAQNALSELGAWLRNPQLVLESRATLEEVFAEQGLQIWSSSPSLNQLLGTWDMLPQIPRPEAQRDFLMIGHLSTGNNPVDKGMSMRAELQTLVDESGKLNHWLSLEQLNEANEISTSPHQSIVRILVPKGSSLTMTKGLKLEDVAVSQYKGYTQWSFSSRVDSGGSSQKELSYQLPWDFEMEDVGKYQLMVMKQPGTPPLQWRHEVSLPTSMELVQILPDNPVDTIEDRGVFAFVARQK